MATVASSGPSMSNGSFVSSDPTRGHPSAKDLDLCHFDRHYGLSIHLAPGNRLTEIPVDHCHDAKGLIHDSTKNEFSTRLLAGSC